MAKKPNIFDYNNFRQFLTDYYSFRHVDDRGFNKAFICRELGLPNTRSYFQDVLNGKIISDLKLPLFIKMLKLDQAESKYFRVLVRFNQCDDPDEKEILLDDLIALNRTPYKILSAKAYSYYKEWYHSLVRAVLEVIDFKKDYADLGKKLIPPVSAKKAKESLTLLSDLGLVKKNDQGFFKPTDSIISTGFFAKEDVVRQFQLKCLDAARYALISRNKQPKRIMIKTISLSDNAYKLLEKRMEKFSAEVRSIVHKDEQKATNVCQLSLLLIPQFRKAEK